jgi:hypothetical protein
VALGDGIGHLLAGNVPHSCDAEQRQTCALHGEDSFVIFGFEVIC